MLVVNLNVSEVKDCSAAKFVWGEEAQLIVWAAGGVSDSDIHLVHLSPFGSYEVHQHLCEVYEANSEYISKQKSV